MRDKLSNGIAQVLLANAINLVISLCNGFIIPKFLSIPSYAGYKTFLLYTSYVGILHFGFIDGVYIKYGGKNIADIDKEEFSSIQKSLFVFQIIVTIIGLIISPFIKDVYLVIALLCVLPTNMQMYYRLIFQATGEFARYRRIINTQSIGVFIFEMIALLVFRIDDARVYCVIYLIISLAIWFWFRHDMSSMYERVRLNFSRLLLICRYYTKLGVVIMLGNFMSVWIASIDRWFVKAKCSVSDFAYYSFAVSLLKLVNVVLGAFSVTLYNYFCDHHEAMQVANIRRKIIIIGSMLISSSFVFKIVIETFLQKYIPAERVMMLLIGSQLFVVIVNAIYLNLYKAMNMQKRYFKIMIKISVIAILLNVLFGYALSFRMESFAYATFLTMIIWIILCQMDMKVYKIDKNEWIYMMLVIIAFFGSDFIVKILFGRFENSVIYPIMWLILYAMAFVLLSVVFFKDDILELIFMSTRILKKKDF